jgi:hypothetical protein
MNEQYLHYLWKSKRLPFHKLKLTNGNEINFVDVGHYNINESGPDFSMSIIKIDNLTWAGSVEIHVNSSDWYKHNHHLDQAYNNVILHVVYHYDKPVKVNGRELPVLELKPYIEKEHFQRFQKFKSNQTSFSFPCKSIFKNKKNNSLKEMIDLAINKRLERKIIEIQSLNHKNSEESLYYLLAKAFGTKVNQQPFEQISYNYPFELISKLKPDKKIEEFIKEVISTNELYLWKRKGMRHHSSPEKRIREFVNLISLFDFSYPFWELPTSIIIEYFYAKFSLVKLHGKMISQNIMINAISVFLYLKGTQINNGHLLKKSIQMLELLPPENNFITRKWQDLTIKAQNAKETQALLEIYQQFCTRKKCLECAIGINFLNT